MDSIFRSIANNFCDFMKLRFIRFALVGSINTLLGFGMYAAFLFSGLSYGVANFLALAVSVIFGFFAQGTFVFGNRNIFLILRFVLAWAIIYILNVAAIEQLIRSGFNAYSSGAVIIIPGAIVSYFLQRFYVFRAISKSN